VYRIARTLLFALNPDRAHDLGQWFFRRYGLWRLLDLGLGDHRVSLSTTLAGMPIPVPIGLAAGFDKNAELARSMMRLGFGFVTVGSVTDPGPGNARPWFRRLPAEGAMINSMGLPSKGPYFVEGKLRALKPEVPIVLSIAANSVDRFVEIATRLSRYASAIEFNISCPNLPKGNRFDEDSSAVDELLEKATPLPGPKFLKMPPYSDYRILLDVCESAHRHRLTGLTIANTRQVNEPSLPLGRGGLSGRPLFKQVHDLVGFVREHYGQEFEIVATGGVFTGKDAYDLIRRGARAVGILTALVYRGPWAAKAICRELAGEMVKAGFSSVDELRGTSKV